MICAIVDQNTMRVINTVIANPENDTPQSGTIMVALGDGDSIDTRWVWDDAAQTFKPGPELQAELDAAAEALTADAFEV